MIGYYKPLLTFLLLTLFPIVDSTLKFVNLVYRHGDRSPVEVFPTDKHATENWPDGLGWLSNIGKNNHYELGQFLRERYVNQSGFMNETYHHRALLVNSSNVERCLMSAYSNLAGFFPPTGRQVWDQHLKWQPIPVHTRPDMEDSVLEETAPCPEYDRIKAEVIAEYQKHEGDTDKAFYEFIANKTGYESETIDSVWSVADTLFCRKAHNITFPEWANDTVYEKLRELDQIGFKLLFADKRLHRLKGGPLLKIMIENMKSKINGFADPLFRMNMFSAHDTTVGSLMMALGVYNDISPPYAACLILELHEDNNQSYVELFYRNETREPYQLKLPGCDFKCPFHQFVNLTSSTLPHNFRKECGLDNGSKTQMSLVVVAAITAASVVVLFLIIIGFGCCIKRRRTRLNYNLLAYT